MNMAYISTNTVEMKLAYLIAVLVRPTMEASGPVQF